MTTPNNPTNPNTDPYTATSTNQSRSLNLRMLLDTIKAANLPQPTRADQTHLLRVPEFKSVIGRQVMATEPPNAHTPAPSPNSANVAQAPVQCIDLTLVSVRYTHEENVWHEWELKL